MNDRERRTGAAAWSSQRSSLAHDPSRIRFAQAVVGVFVLAVYVPTAVAGVSLAAALLTHPQEIARRAWWLNLWGAAGVALIGWLAWKNRDLMRWPLRRSPGLDGAARARTAKESDRDALRQAANDDDAHGRAHDPGPGLVRDRS